VVEVLLALHVILLIMLFRIMQDKLGRIIALVFLVYISTFTVLKPALLFYADIYLPYSTNSEEAVVSLLIGSLIFLAVQLIAVKYFTGSRPSRYFKQIFDLSHATTSGIWGAYVLLMGVAFIGSVIKFGDVGYLLSSASTFDATMNQADGSWYINYIAECLMYGLLAVMAFYYHKLPGWKSFLLFVTVIAFTYFWTRMAARTGILVTLIAWLCCAVSLEKQRKLNLIYISLFGYMLLILLYVGNLVRLGSAQNINMTTALFGAVTAAMSDLGPVDNAVLLYSEMHRHASTWFVQLLGAVSPFVLIPSSIFPLKIPADKDSELTRTFFPDGADTSFYHEGSTLTFTVPGSGYADAGFFGTFVSCVIYAVVFCVYIRLYRRGSPSTRFFAAVLLLIHIVGYRLSIEALMMTFYTSLLFIGATRFVAMMFSPMKNKKLQVPRQT